MNRVLFPLSENGRLDLSQIKHGIILLTFDDASYDTWIPHLDLFDKYNARGTFFYHKEITREAADSMKQLLARGHSVGFHSTVHKDAVNMDPADYYAEYILPQIRQAESFGIRDIPFFAYPNNRHSDEFDIFLSRYFTRFRAGAEINVPKGYRIADFEELFVSLDEIPSRRVMRGNGIGPFYLSTQENLDAALEKAARENKLITFFTHSILKEAASVHISEGMLEAVLHKAASLGMAAVGFNELP